MIADLGKTSQVLPLIIFGVPCLIAAVLVSGLPETLGAPMLDTIDDLSAPGPRDASSGGCPWLMRRYRQLDEESRELEVRNRPEPHVLGASA